MSLKPENTKPQSVSKANQEVTLAAEAKTVPVATGIVAQIFQLLEQAYDEARRRVDAAEAELNAAQAEFAAVRLMMDTKAGKVHGGSPSTRPKGAKNASSGVSGGGGRSPRGAVPKQVQDALSNAGKTGLSRSELAGKLGISAGDKKASTSISNALSALQRSSTVVRNEDGRYHLSV